MKYILQKDGKVKINRVVEEIIDLPKLKEQLKEMGVEKKPSDGDVLKAAKVGIIHPYYETKERKEQLRKYIRSIEEKVVKKIK
jgi:hypothetical protein